MKLVVTIFSILLFVQLGLNMNKDFSCPSECAYNSQAEELNEETEHKNDVLSGKPTKQIRTLKKVKQLPLQKKQSGSKQTEQPAALPFTFQLSSFSIETTIRFSHRKIQCFLLYWEISYPPPRIF